MRFAFFITLSVVTSAVFAIPVPLGDDSLEVRACEYSVVEVSIMRVCGADLLIFLDSQS